MIDFYLCRFRTSLAAQLQYRGALLIWAFSSFFQPLIFLVVWASVATSSGGAVGGFTAADFSAYFMVSLLVNHLTFTWIMWEFEFRIRSGSFSPLLLRPIHPIHGDVVENITYKLLALTFLLPACGVLALMFEPRWNFHWWSVAAFVPALVLAGALRFLLEWALALAAFWVVRVSAINQMYFAVSLFLSGQMAPLALLPKPIQVAAEVLPFRWMVSFPVELMLGRLTPREALTGLGAQVVWVGLAFLVMRSLWGGAVRRHSGVGA